MGRKMNNLIGMLMGENVRVLAAKEKFIEVFMIVDIFDQILLQITIIKINNFPEGPIKTVWHVTRLVSR